MTASVTTLSTNDMSQLDSPKVATLRPRPPMYESMAKSKSFRGFYRRRYQNQTGKSLFDDGGVSDFDNFERFSGDFSPDCELFLAREKSRSICCGGGLSVWDRTLGQAVEGLKDEGELRASVGTDVGREGKSRTRQRYWDSIRGMGV